MQKIILTLWLTCFFQSANAQETSILQSHLPALEKIIIDGIDLYKIPGLAVAFVEGDKIIYAKAFGIKSVFTNEPVTTETIFQIGSVTKAFTATLMAKLMAEGKIDWNKTVKSYVNDFDIGNDERNTKMTLKDVLTQRSGYHHYAGDQAIQAGKSYDEALESLKSIKPDFPLGQKFSYLNVLYCLCDKIMKRNLSGDWHQMMQDHILKPANMLEVSSNRMAMEKALNHAESHGLTSMGPAPVGLSGFGYLIPCAGGLNMHIMDLAKFLKLHINEGQIDGKQLIPAHLIKELHNPHISTVGRETAGGSRVFYFPRERVDKTYYGMGFRMCDWAGHRILGHGGYVKGQLANFTIIPEKKVGVAILCNMSSQLPSVLRAHFIDLMYNLPPIDWLQRARLKREKAELDALKPKKSSKKKNTKKQKIAKKT